MQNKRTTVKLIALLCLMAISIIITGCVGVGSAQAGWSGVISGDGSVYLGAANGELVALNAENGFYQWQQELETTSSGGGLLGCAGAASTVIYATPVLNQETLYIGDFSGRLYAFSVIDRQSKSVLLDNSAAQSIIGSPLVSHNTVYVTSTDGNLYAFDAASLTFKWKYNTGGEIWSSPAVWQDSIFTASFDSKLYSLNAESGQPNWDEPFECDGPIIASPVVYEDTVIVASLDRHLYGLDAATGQLLWKYPAENTDGDSPEQWLWTTPVVYEGTVYAACMDGNVYVVDSGTGQFLTSIDIGEPVSSKPVLVGSRLVLCTQNGKVYSVDTQTSTRVQLRDLDAAVSAPLGTDGSTVFVHSIKENSVYAVNGETGALLWSTSIN